MLLDTRAGSSITSHLSHLPVRPKEEPPWDRPGPVPRIRFGPADRSGRRRSFFHLSTSLPPSGFLAGPQLAVSSSRTPPRAGTETTSGISRSPTGIRFAKAPAISKPFWGLFMLDCGPWIGLRFTRTPSNSNPSLFRRSGRHGNARAVSVVSGRACCGPLKVRAPCHAVSGSCVARNHAGLSRLLVSPVPAARGRDQAHHAARPTGAPRRGRLLFRREPPGRAGARDPARRAWARPPPHARQTDTPAYRYDQRLMVRAGLGAIAYRAEGRTVSKGGL